MVKASDVPEPFISHVEAVQEVKSITLEESIEKIKVRTLHKLSAECETKGVKEPDSIVIFDSNNLPSFGKYMWQTDSMQRYVLKWYGKKITRKEAILIALGEGSIDLEEVTRKTLFDEPASQVNGRWRGGWANWYNCANKLDLKKEIEIINQLGK